MLIVVVIISMLASVGAVNLLRSRVTGHEAMALADLRQLMIALQAYHAVNQTYPNPLGLLSDADPPFVQTSITGGSGANGHANLAGYAYAYTWEDAFNYRFVAQPVTQGVTGVRRFFLDETGVIRQTLDGTDPTENSPPIP